MVIRPDDAASLAKGVRELFVESETLMLSKLAKALAEGVDAPDWVERKLIGIRGVLTDVDLILGDIRNDTPIMVDQAINLAYNRGIATAGGELTAAGLGAGAFDTIQPTGAVTALVREALGRTDPMVAQISRSVADIYQQTITQTTAQVLTGAQTRREASRTALVRLAQNGVAGFTDKSGRRWEMASYAEMAVRTTASNAMLQGHTDRLAELGVELVQVSDAPEECSICRPYEGQVLSLTGGGGEKLSDGTRVMGSLSEARAAGLYHPNCRHSHSIYIPGVTKRRRDTADPAGDELRQQQRGFERRVRELKRRDAIDQEFGGPQATATRATLRAKQAEFADWREANGRKNLAYRTSLKNR
jgi:hypothetical protein